MFLVFIISFAIMGGIVLSVLPLESVTRRIVRLPYAALLLIAGIFLIALLIITIVTGEDQISWVWRFR